MIPYHTPGAGLVEPCVEKGRIPVEAGLARFQKADNAELQSDMTEMKANVAALQSDMTEVKGNVEELREFAEENRAAVNFVVEWVENYAEATPQLRRVRP